MLARLRFISGNVLCLCAMLTASPCNAQDAEVLPALYSSPEFQKSVLQKAGKQTLAAGQRSVLGDQAPLSSAAVHFQVSPDMNAELDYQASDGISQTLRQQLADKVAMADPAQASGVRGVFSTDRLLRQLGDFLHGFGFSSRNLADMMTSYYVASWEIVHGTTAQPSSFRAARRQLATSLEKCPEIILMTDPEKQRSAEALGIVTAVATQGSQALLEQDDQIGYIALQEAVYQSLLLQGIDLRRLQLGRWGFVSG